MKWITILIKATKQILKKLKDSHFFKASLAISLILVIRKLITKNSGSAAEAKIILENISAFYDKLHSKSISSVNIFTNYIEL